MKTWHDVAVGWDDNYDYIAADAETLTGGNIILIPDPDGIWQPFVIRQADTAIGDSLTKTVEADHLYYELGDGQPKSFSLINATPSTAMTAALEGTRWQVGNISASLTGITKDLSGEFLSPLARLRQIETEYEARLRFRCAVTDGIVTGLYVDLLEIDQAFRGQRFEFGRNLQSIKITTDFSEIKTALIGTAIGEEVDPLTGDPLPLTFRGVEWSMANGDPTDKPYGQDWVGDEEARQLYGIPDGQGGMLHRFGVHESEGVTPLGVLQGTWTALRNRNRPSITIEATLADLEQVKVVDIETGEPVQLSHEKIRLGNLCHVIARHKGIKAALELRVSRLIRPLKRQEATEVTLGDLIPLQSQRLIEMERWQKWADRRRRQLDRGKGPATVVIASENTSKTPWYAHIIVPKGATNFQEYFAQALAMLPDKGGQIVIQEGEYVYSGNMVISKDNVKIAGQGAGTVLRLRDGITAQNLGFFAEGKTGVQISDLTIDGNKGNQIEGFHCGIYLWEGCKDFSIENTTVSNFRSRGIAIANSHEGGVRGCTCTDNDSIGIYIGGSTEIVVTGNNCNDNGSQGIYIQDSTNIAAATNTCRRNGQQGILLFRAEQCSVTDNKCYQSGDGGYYSGIYLWESNRNVVSGNTCDGNSGGGIKLEDSSGNTVANNSAQGNELTGIAIGAIGAEASNDNIVSSNQCASNGLHGIFVSGDRNTITGNNCSTNAFSGILVAGNRNSLQNNRCADNGTYGIQVTSSGADNLVTNNDLTGNTKKNFSNLGTGTIDAPGNRV